MSQQAVVYSHVNPSWLLGAQRKPWPSIPSGNFEAGLRRYGVMASKVHGERRVEAGTTAVISGGLDLRSALEGQRLVSQDPDQFKRWIGLDEKQLASGLYVALDRTPSRPASPELLRPTEQLRPEELRDVELAMATYLFGDARKVVSWREAIVRHLAPFHAAVYAARRVVVEPGATLAVHGLPAVLLFQELVIRPGGSLRLFTVANAFVESLVKHEA
jgi:hypothetical protein